MSLSEAVHDVRPIQARLLECMHAGYLVFHGQHICKLEIRLSSMLLRVAEAPSLVPSITACSACCLNWLANCCGFPSLLTVS